ncbi:MAG: hypothetical protein BHV90_00330 [Clostridiales bacterium 42_27]|nr:MAG: hypothetical protein BHV90_00330 [Clostridiales bacterium 42_27]
MKKETKKQLLIGAALVLELLLLLLYLNGRINKLLDSDMSSEMVLGQLLAQNNELMTTKFYYSTEMRVLSIQLVFALCFKLFRDWHVIRMVVMVCLWVILIVAYYFLCRAMECRKYFLLTALLLFAPVSSCYFEFMLVAACYIPYVAIAFAALALNEVYFKAQPDRKKFWLVVSVLLALVAGLGGPREIIALYAPLGLAAAAELAWERNNETKRVGASALIGYALNMLVLARIYTFSTWGSLGFMLADGARIKEIFYSFLTLYGAAKEIAGSTFLFVLSAAWIVLTIGCIVYAYTHKVSEGYRRLAGFVSAGYVVYILLYLLTDMPFNERYGLLNTVLSVPLFAVALKEVRVKEHVKKAVTTVFLAAVAAGCVLLLVRMDGVDETLGKRVIADKMVAEGYENGYATFWNGNVMTELSGGKIQMWVWRDATLDQHGPDVDEIYPWLQLTSHDTERPTGKVFVLFSREEFGNNPWKQNLQPEDVIYESEEYVVLGYPDYETMKATLEKDL